jgi:hypothetical protein
VFQQQVPSLGREADLQQLDRVLTRGAAGGGSVVLLSGETGIGKTRLCQELGRSHRDRGGQVLVGRAFPEEAAISFGAVADALRAARRGEPALWKATLARASVLWAIAAAVPEPPNHRPPRRPHPDQAGLCLTRTDRRLGGRAAQRPQLITAAAARPHGPAEPFAGHRAEWSTQPM